MLICIVLVIVRVDEKIHKAAAHVSETEWVRNSFVLVNRIREEASIKVNAQIKDIKSRKLQK